MRNALLAVVALAVASSSQAAISLTAIAKVSLNSTQNNSNPEFVGSNPNTVAWDGTNAYIGGYNGSGLTANTAIVKYSNVLTGPTAGTAFGSLSTPNGRGITGLAIQGGNLAIAYDNGGGSADSVRLFNTSTLTQTWRIGDPTAGNDLTRRGNGVAFDPGFNAAGSNQGVAYLSIGSGRRHLLNTATGTYINGQNAGAVINFGTVSTTFRDLAFDPTNGDLYTRESNRLGKAVRTGDNAFATQVAIGGLATSTLVDNENLTFITGGPAVGGNKFIVLNDRPNTTADTLANTVKFFDTAGNLQTASFDFAAVGGDPATGGKAYDFSYDAATSTLAVVDFTNRDLYIFSVVPEPTTLGVAGAAITLLARRRR